MATPRKFRLHLSPIFIGVAAVAKEPLSDDEASGITVLAGFDACKGPDKASDYLYLRGL